MNSLFYKVFRRYVFQLVIISTVSVFMGFKSPVFASDEALVLTTGIGAPLINTESSEGFVETLAVEIFKRIGVAAKIEIVPSKLSLVTANNGREDGVVLRIKGIDKTYNNLIMVPETIMCSEFSAYSLNKIRKLSKWSDLSRYEVAYVNGWRIFERNVVNGPSVRKADSANALFKMLKDQRIEVVLYEKWQGIVLAKNIGLDHINVNKLPIERKQMFIYLHKKHKDLINKLAQTLREIKQDGTYNAIYLKTLSKYVGAPEIKSSSDSKHVLLGC